MLKSDKGNYLYGKDVKKNFEVRKPNAEMLIIVCFYF